MYEKSQQIAKKILGTNGVWCSHGMSFDENAFQSYLYHRKDGEILILTYGIEGNMGQTMFLRGDHYTEEHLLTIMENSILRMCVATEKDILGIMIDKELMNNTFEINHYLE